MILLDDSDDLGSSYWRLAKATVSGILDTLGPNDFVNVYRYSDTVNEVHQCYSKILAQVSIYLPLNSTFTLKDKRGIKIFRRSNTATMIKCCRLLLKNFYLGDPSGKNRGIIISCPVYLGRLHINI